MSTTKTLDCYYQNLYTQIRSSTAKLYLRPDRRHYSSTNMSFRPPPSIRSLRGVSRSIFTLKKIPPKRTRRPSPPKATQKSRPTSSSSDKKLQKRRERLKNGAPRP
mmetsp:Transcript_4231/g.8186  ORF Transcript_4231/g.8186 Transcript_4231/m.8186 type:complete len:106 (+) Transcript_4231:87-404(+)